MPVQAAQTAVGPLTAVAIEQYSPAGQRLVQDEWAARILTPAIQRLVRLTAWPPARKMLFRLLETRAHGVWGGVLCHKCYIAEKTADALEAGIEAVVILSAGMDTTACRLGNRGARFYEVDLPVNSATKRIRLEQIFGSLPAHICLAPVDLDQQDPGSALATQGFKVEGRSFFICEAVTQYLTEAGVRKLFGFLARAGAGSRLVFTYITRVFLDGRACSGVEAVYQRYRVKERLWRFGLQPGRVAGFLGEYGWQEVEQVGSQEYIERYLKPTGRSLPVMDIERAVYAGKMDQKGGFRP